MTTPSIISYLLDDINEVDWNEVKAIPCWSVGRLMEIRKICHSFPWENTIDDALIDIITSDFEACIKYFDFSKLEE